MIHVQRGWFALLTSLGESAPFVILGLLLAGAVREFVPAAALKRHLGGSGVAPVLRAVGLGAILPICSCSTIPLGLGMARTGAGVGTALAFMTSAPAVSPVTVVLGMSLLGPVFLGAYSIAVVCGALVIGLAGNALLPAQVSDPADAEGGGRCGCGCNHQPPATRARLLAAVRWSLFDLGSEVSLSLLAGLIVATALLIFTPDEWVLELMGQPGFLAIVAVILLALPAYTCSVPALLIAASLLAKGADAGAAAAFLIAGPATNLGELNSIRAGFGWRSAAFYIAAVLLLAVAAAMAIGSLPLPSVAHQPHAVENGHNSHGHVHFGADQPTRHETDFDKPPVPAWRWPFVMAIAVLACHRVYLKRLSKRPPQDNRHLRSTTAIDAAELVALKSQPN